LTAMKQIRDNIFEISHTELGSPDEYGRYKVEGLGTVHIDIADVRYIADHKSQGYEPTFFVSRAPAMNNDFVVVARNRKA